MTFSSGTARGVVGATVAMSGVGTLTAVNAMLGHYPVFGGQALRYVVAATVLLTIARLRTRGPGSDARVGWRDFALLVGLAATGLAGFNVCIVNATRSASPATVGTVIATVPVVLAVVGPLQQGRRPMPRAVFAALVVTLGAGLATGLGEGSPSGLAWSLGALAGEAGFSLLAVPLLPRLGALRVSAYSAALAVPMLIAAGLIADGRHLLRVPTVSEGVALGYLALAITVVLFLVWYDALGRLGADRAGLFAGLIPISAVVTTVVLGLAVPGPADVAGAVLVGAGVVIGMRARPTSPDGAGDSAHPVREPAAAP